MRKLSGLGLILISFLFLEYEVRVSAVLFAVGLWRLFALTYEPIYVEGDIIEPRIKKSKTTAPRVFGDINSQFKSESYKNPDVNNNNSWIGSGRTSHPSERSTYTYKWRPRK